MSNFDRAVKVLDSQGAYCGQCSREPGDSLDDCRDCAAVLETYAHALEAAGLLAPDVQVVRTVEELEALDGDACTLDKYGDFDFAKDWIDENGEMFAGHEDFLPAVVFATGERVRAAREVMEATCTTRKN